MANAKLTEIDSAGLPFVSIIVPIYNGEADLPDLLHCLRAQSYPADRVEFLLIDNNSSDRTLALLQSAAQDLSETHNIRVLSETRIQSSYAARNCGIRAAIGEILAFTDADCRPQPDWLLHLVQPFQQQKTTGIVAGEILPLPGNTLLERYADRHEILSQRHTLSHPFYAYGQTANLAIRRQALEQAGIFRPWLTTGGDADLCWRIQQSGWQLGFAQTAIVQHRHRSTWRELRQQWMRYGRSNRYLHELHGVALAQPLNRREILYRLSRCLLKEVPIALRQTLWQQDAPESIWLQQPWLQQPLGFDRVFDTPIGILCHHWRMVGQQSQLAAAAREIEWLALPAVQTTKNL